MSSISLWACVCLNNNKKVHKTNDDDDDDDGVKNDEDECKKNEGETLIKFMKFTLNYSKKRVLQVYLHNAKQNKEFF